MFEKLKISKETLSKLIIVIFVAAIFMLTMSILTDEQDTRRRVSDSNGATESALCSFLSNIEGVGAVNALIECDNDNNVIGVVVTADGADDPVVRNNIVKGVSTLYDVPASSIMVFKKDLGGNDNEKE